MFTNKFSKIPHYYNLLSTFILYPNPLTVISDFGFAGVISIFSLMRRRWASSEFPYPNGLSPQDVYKRQALTTVRNKKKEWKDLDNHAYQAGNETSSNVVEALDSVDELETDLPIKL